MFPLADNRHVTMMLLIADEQACDHFVTIVLLIADEQACDHVVPDSR